MPAKRLARGALIGALYALLTCAAAPISSGLLQIRLSEALSILPFLCPEAVPGLFIGCLAANLIMGGVWLDIVFGSLATLLAAYLTAWLKKKGASKFLAPAPAVLINAVIVGILLCYAYDVGASLPVCMAYVAAGQAIACYGLGMPLLITLEKYAKKLFE